MTTSRSDHAGPSPGLAGSHVLVVGGSSGIGLAVAAQARTLGATVTLAGMDAARLADASAITGCNALPNAVPISAERSTTTTLTLSLLPNISRKRAGISVAASIPVKPPPTTTTELRAGDGGKSGK